MKRNKIINLKYYLLTIIISFIVGVFWHKFQLEPIGIIREISNKYKLSFIKEKEMKKVKKWHEAKFTFCLYKKGIPVFLDRSYSDEIGDKRLDNLYLIQIPRHFSNNIILKSSIPFTVYRILPLNEQNLKYNYEKTDIKVKVVGHSITHNIVLKKLFEPGIISLNPGGPTSSSPILISTNEAKPINKFIKIVD
tara:strand:- start:612 stop:1190 length:579 start_codon:yes stop_codon:yes gene_type:complete